MKIKQHLTTDCNIFFMTLLLDFLTITFNYLSIFARSYHLTTIVLISGNSIYLDVGLLTVQVYGTPEGLLGRFQPKLLTTQLSSFINIFHGKTLAELENTACSSTQLFNTELDDTCTSLMLLRIVSYIFVICFICSSMLLLCCFVALIRFYNIKKTIFLYRIILLFHILPSFFIYFGSFTYLFIGGTDVSFIPDIPFFMSDLHTIDLGVGYMSAIGCGLFGMISPVILYFGVNKNSCEDYFDVISCHCSDTDPLFSLLEDTPYQF